MNYCIHYLFPASHDEAIKSKHFPRNWPFVPVTAEFPLQKPVTRIFDVFFDLRLNKRLNKQRWAWWFQTPSHSLWRHCNGYCRWVVASYITWITGSSHDDVIKWKHFPRYWPFVRGIHRSRWTPHTKASDAELWCFLWSALVIWDAIVVIMASM